MKVFIHIIVYYTQSWSNGPVNSNYYFITDMLDTVV